MQDGPRGPCLDLLDFLVHLEMMSPSLRMTLDVNFCVELMS